MKHEMFTNSFRRLSKVSKQLFALLFTIGILTSCDKSCTPEVENSFPVCIEDVIAAADTVDDISKIIQYDYNGEKVYLLHNSAMSVDYGPLLYNDTCGFICYFAGFGGWQATDTSNQNYCLNYDLLKVNEIVIWEKP
jgi:hypothetical protein